MRERRPRAASGPRMEGDPSTPRSGVRPAARMWSKPRPTDTYTVVPGAMPTKVATTNAPMPMRVRAGTMFTTQNGAAGMRRRDQKIAERVLVEALLQLRDERAGAFSGDVREHSARRKEDDTRPGGGAKQNEDDTKPAEQRTADKRERRRDGKREGDNDNIEQHEGDGRDQEPVLDRGLEVAIVGGNGLPAQALVPAEPEEGHKPKDKHHGQPKSF